MTTKSKIQLGAASWKPPCLRYQVFKQPRASLGTWGLTTISRGDFRRAGAVDSWQNLDYVQCPICILCVWFLNFCQQPFSSYLDFLDEQNLQNIPYGQSSAKHPVIMSSRHLVIWSSIHQVIRSSCNYVIRSSCYHVILSSGCLVILLSSHLVIWSGHLVIRSSSH